MHIVIIANGDISRENLVKRQIKAESLVVAVDGGYNYCVAHNIHPNVLIGDFDSIKRHGLDNIQRTQVEIIQHSSEKDETDLELAIDYAKSLYPSQIDVFGALGARVDMTISNILFLSCLKGGNLSINIWHEDSQLIPLHPDTEHKFYIDPGSVVSLIPITPEVKGITTQGLKYPLNKESLYANQTRGISNISVQESIGLTFDEGILLLTIINPLGQSGQGE